MYFVLDCFGGAAPGAASTPRQRGPWRPHRTGRQGRLPTWKASPRRELLVHLLHSKYMLDKVKKFSWMSVLTTLMVVVGAIWRPPVSVSRAMVVGMAMAPANAPSRDWEAADGRNGGTGLLEGTDATYRSTEDPVGIVGVTLTFTPLHTGSSDGGKFAVGMIVWGWPPPRETGAS